MYNNEVLAIEGGRSMKIGLVLEGGAHRTIFSCGVMDALLDAKIRADYVIGSSAGITYGVSYVSGQHGRNREMQRRFVRNPRYAGLLHRLNPLNRSYYNLKFVFSEIPNRLLPFDYLAYESQNAEVLAAVTNMDTGEAEYLPVNSGDKEWTVLQATCALPLMFKPIEIDGKRYADGGVADSIPFEKALADGCDKVIVVLTRERDYHKTEESLMSAIAKNYQRKYPDYAQALLTRHERYNKCIAKLNALEAEGKVYVIAPRDTLGVKRTDKRVDKLMALYGQGYALTAQQMDRLKAYLEAEVSETEIPEETIPAQAIPETEVPEEELPEVSTEISPAEEPQEEEPTDTSDTVTEAQENTSEETEQNQNGRTEI